MPIDRVILKKIKQKFPFSSLIPITIVVLIIRSMCIFAACPRPKITAVNSLAAAAALNPPPPPLPVYNFELHLICYIDCGLWVVTPCNLVDVCQHF